MTTTYDPFVPADGADQPGYDGHRRAEGRVGGAGWGGEQSWDPDPRWAAAPQPVVPEQRWSTDPRWDQPQQQWEQPQRQWEQPQQQWEQRWTPEPAEPPRASRNRAKPLLIGLVVLLVLVAGWQAYRIELMSSDNASMHSVLAAEKERTDRLEKQLAGVFDPEAVSSSVLPSVFRVRAGEFTGTAFAVGSKADSGTSNLFTNYHVVAEVWVDGGRTVSLERGNTRIEATIVRVNKGKDLALLRADQEINGLSAATGQVKPGQQVVVVGAPLGLDDSVTTGVISAYRPNDKDGTNIQFDAPINPGNSGGPVVNASNQVVGVATAKAKDAEGIGLAIDIKVACSTYKNIC